MIGAIFGSFINVVAIRVHEGSSLIGRSHCMHCHANLKFRHMVPILSWIMMRGRCAECGKKIHIQYPLIEAAAAVLAIIYMVSFLNNGDLSRMLFNFFFSVSLLIFVVMDIRWCELPLELMVGAGIVFSIWDMLLHVTENMSPVMIAWSHASGFSVATLFFLFQWVVSKKRWIGSGDIWFGAVLGAVLGWPLVGLAVYFAYIFGGATALGLIILKKLKPGARVPFAPALVAGALAAMWWGSWIFNWLHNAMS